MQPENLKAQVAACLENQTLHYAVLSRPALKGAEVVKVTVRPLMAKGGLCYQLTKHLKQKVLHVNYPPSDILGALWALVGADFSQAVFFTAEADYQVLVDKRRQWTILRKKPSHKAVNPSHNRLKSYVLGEGKPVPFLVELGVMRPDGSIVPKMAHKFRQINRFVEIVADIFPDLPTGKRLDIVDFGCGKSYLTFAVYHYLHNIQKRDVSILGLDLKTDVIAACQALADKLGYAGLRFQVGDINAHHPGDKIDMVVSLHACDTATDAALEKAVRWGADVILCVPCCQHELYSQVDNEALFPLLKHGILKERFAALATDAARAQLLELSGYRTQVMEFIDMEHTPKNLLIRAVKAQNQQDRAGALVSYQRFVQFLSVDPSLERRLPLNERRDKEPPC